MHDILMNWIKKQSLLNITIHNLRVQRKAERFLSVAVQSRNKHFCFTATVLPQQHTTTTTTSIQKMPHISQLGAPRYILVIWGFGIGIIKVN